MYVHGEISGLITRQLRISVKEVTERIEEIKVTFLDYDDILLIEV